MQVLVVDADPALAQFLHRSFENVGCAADVSTRGEKARELVEERSYDVVILDLNLPDIDGLELLRQIRARNSALPVIALTSRREIADRVKALDLGADDYLLKPFSFAELAARVRALRRRAQRMGDPVLRVGDLELDRLERRASRAGRVIDLTLKELSLLEYLMLNEGQCVSREMIVANAWKMRSDGLTNVVDVYVNYLRKKIDDGFDAKLIHTVRGSGYQLRCEGPRAEHSGGGRESNRSASWQEAKLR
jgi:DNA-binding response OmpR family regulator